LEIHLTLQLFMGYKAIKNARLSLDWLRLKYILIEQHILDTNAGKQLS
jgi:hypothetical protein